MVVPYDPFKVDIRILGNMFRHLLYDVSFIVNMDCLLLIMRLAISQC